MRYISLSYTEPGKVAHYQYLAAGYQLILDTFIFNRTFVMIQWVGFIFLFILYAVKFYFVFKEAKVKENYVKA